MIGSKLDNQKQEIISDYKNGMRIDDMEKKYKSTSIWYNLNKWNIKRKRLTHSKYSFNENYFEKIDTQDKAYFLGFFMADGNVRIEVKKNGYKMYRITLGLHIKDLHILKMFEKCIEVEPHLYYSNNGNTVSSINFSRKMFGDLGKWGVIPRKSLVLKFPKNLPKDMIRHVIRGYFDGDGSVGIGKGEASLPSIPLRCSFLGTRNCLNYIRNHFGCVGGCLSYRNRATGFSSLGYTSNVDLYRVYQIMYEGSSVYLTRKYKKWQKVVGIIEKISASYLRADEKSKDIRSYRKFHTGIETSKKFGVSQQTVWSVYRKGRKIRPDIYKDNWKTRRANMVVAV